MDLQNWVSKLQTRVESPTNTFQHHHRETVIMLLTELGLVLRSLAHGRMAGVRHKQIPHPTFKYFLVSFFNELPNTKPKGTKFNTFLMLEITCNANVAKGQRLMLCLEFKLPVTDILVFYWSSYHLSAHSRQGNS